MTMTPQPEQDIDQIEAGYASMFSGEVSATVGCANDPCEIAGCPVHDPKDPG